MAVRGTIQSKQGLIGKVVNSPVNRTTVSAFNFTPTSNVQGLIGKVVNSPVNRTSISSQNFKPRANIAMSDITDVEFTSKANGDILIYNASSEKFELNNLSVDLLGLDTINGGRF